MSYIFWMWNVLFCVLPLTLNQRCILLQGIPFRTSHDIVGKAVAMAVSKRVELSNLSLEELQGINSIFEKDVYNFLGVENSIAKFRSYGSTGAEPVAEQMNFWRSKLGV